MPVCLPFTVDAYDQATFISLWKCTEQFKKLVNTLMYVKVLRYPRNSEGALGHDQGLRDDVSHMVKLPVAKRFESSLIPPLKR